jgi:putative restriction endonuclease
MADGLASYLELSEADARAQWRRVRQRVQRVSQSRQERFLPIEVLLSYALFFILNPHSFGGANIDKVPEAVKRLAATLHRSAGSLTSKMLNLDGSRENSARLEPELFAQLAAEPARFAELYLRILNAARAEEFGPEQVPDFLNALPGQGVQLLGQDELGSAEIEHLLEEEKEEVEKLKESFHLGEQQTTRLVEQRARLGQHRFAAQVLSNYEQRCAFCGFAPHSLLKHGLLIASHIKPWAKSDNKERLDPQNGIATCPMHDVAFDSGLITVTKDLSILRADRLQRSMAADAGADLYFGEQILGSRLKVIPKQDRPGSPYLDYHFRHVFKGPRAGT